MIVDVVWELAKGSWWDQGLLIHLIDRRAWRPVAAVTFREYVGIESLPDDSSGAVVILPGRHVLDKVRYLNRQIARLPWCLLIVGGDEESSFPWWDIKHPNMIRWIMTPRPGGPEGAVRYLGEFWPEHCPEMLRAHTDVAFERPQAWSFAGQVTHARRRACIKALKEMRRRIPGELVQTATFATGLAAPDYYRSLAAAKIAPCPSGPATPDSFRLFEALEAGCLPVADGYCPAYPEPGYWDMLFDGPPPFPVIERWNELRVLMPFLLQGWPANANRVFAWWQGYKRSLSYALDDTVRQLNEQKPERASVADLITVLIPTSPIPSHPDTAIIAETIASIRAKPDLAECEIIVMADGVRAEQETRRSDYEEYLRRLLWLTNHEWYNVVPIISDGHVHQANLTRMALREVRTPQVLFVEHDTPLCGEIPFAAMTEVIHSGEANLIRLHHEAHVLDPHQHLMLDKEPHVIAGLPLLRTVQWSQRPHLAATGFYRQLINTYFGQASRTMIEDVMHGVVHNVWRTKGVKGWERWKLWMYAPNGDMKRSLHSDGRGDDPKYDCRFEYDGLRPRGAPNPTSTRVD